MNNIVEKLRLHGISQNSSSGGGGNLNIFTGLTEPETKQGVWIQTDREYQKVVNDTQLYFADAWITQSQYPVIPKIVSKGASDTFTVNTDIYIDTGNPLGLSKFDTINKVFTELGAMGSGGTVILSCIMDGYLYRYTRGDVSNYYLVKIDLVTKNTEYMLRPPSVIGINNAISFVHNNQLYLFGGGASNNTLVRYNKENNTYTNLASHPSQLTGATIQIVGDLIYTFQSRNVRTYDFLSNLWSSVEQTAPYDIDDSTSISIGKNIYLIGLYFNSLSVLSYSYDTESKVYTAIPVLPISRRLALSEFVDGKMYVFGGTDVSARNSMNVFSFDAKVFDEDTFLLMRLNEFSGQHKTELVSPSVPIEGEFPTIKSSFDNAWMYYDSDIQEFLPTYYGDGTQWVKFKN